MSSSASKMSSLTGVHTTFVVQQSCHSLLLDCFCTEAQVDIQITFSTGMHA